MWNEKNKKSSSRDATPCVAIMSSLLAYFAALPPVALDRLFGNGWLCQGILRALPPLPRLYALRLVLVSADEDGALPLELVSMWPEQTSDGIKRHDHALNALRQLNLLKEGTAGATERAVWLHRGFARQLRDCLCVGGVLADELAQSEAARPASSSGVSAAQLEHFASDAWERVLQAILRPPAEDVALSMKCEARPQSLQDLLCEAGLLRAVDDPVEVLGASGRRFNPEDDEYDEDAAATSDANAAALEEMAAAGISTHLMMSRGAYRFLLQPTHLQVWKLVRAYMELADRGARGTRDATLCFLMRLGLLQPGKPYRMDDVSLDDGQRTTLADMALIGLVYRPPDDPLVYYATHFAQHLLSGSSAATSGASAATAAGGAGATPAAAPASSSAAGGFLVLETNFRLYAYTSSPLWVQVIALFVRVEYVLPNLIVAKVTRESTHRAIDCGITPSDIHTFLERNAHPRMHEQTPCLPETVINQMNLWAKERDRVTMHSVYFYEGFQAWEEFKALEEYARDNRVLVWSKGDAAAVHKCMVAVNSAAHQQMRSFLKNRRAQQASKSNQG